MIKVRLNALSEGHTTERLPKESLKALVKRVLEENGHKEITDDLLQFIVVYINGMEIEKELWASVYYEDSDDVLVGSVIKGGNFGQIFKQVAILAVAITAAYFFPPAAGLTNGLIVAAATIGTTLLLNSLIPPPGLDGSLGGLDFQSLSSSQMYSITGQSNQVKRFGGVPRVYGRHRIFPVVAANPYTQIEVDPSTGELVQYFYGIYDFGYGPLLLDDFRLGDTPLSNYSDVEYRLVDLKKPLVSEGLWDAQVYSDFALYKGDIESDQTSVSINGNEEGGSDITDYQIIRNASSKVEGNDQEIFLNFVCPQGLIAYGTNGNTYDVNIDLEIHFSKIGEDNWIAFNDYDYVYGFTYAGGSDFYTDTQCTLLPFTTANFTLLETYQWSYVVVIETTTNWDFIFGTNNMYGIPQGTTNYTLLSTDADVGERLYWAGQNLGKIISKTPHGSISGYSVYVTDTPSPTSFTLFGIFIQENTLDQYPISVEPIRIMRSKRIESRARITRKETGQVYSTVSFRPKEIAAYKVRIKRVRTVSSADYRVLSDLSLYNLSTRFNRNPIVTDNRHVFLELRIRATNQLNGTISNLSAIGQSVLDTYDQDTESWTKRPTSNPAWVFCDLLTGEINKKRIDRSRLHLPSIVEWANFCDEVPTAPPSQTYVLPRFTTNFVLDFDATLQQVVNLVTNSAQASLNIIDGKYGLLIDRLRTTPVQIFTPKNSWGFSSTRNYVEKPHALKVGYIDPAVNWEAREVVVYDNNYDESTATLIDSLDTFATTNYEQAYRFGRYMLAQNRLRQENMTITVDFEHLVCTRGDYVRLVQDTMKVGGRAARVKTVVGTIITINEDLEILPATNYGYVYRNVQDGILKSTLTPINSFTFDLDGSIPSVGDLIVIGQVDFEYIDCIVKAINPQSDLTAQLTLVEKADGVYLAESSGTIPEYNAQIAPTENTEFTPPGEVQALQILENTFRCLGSDYQYYITIDWDVPASSVYAAFEIYVDFGRGYKLANVTNDTIYEYIVTSTYLGIEHKFKVLAISANGNKLDIGGVSFVSATPVNKTTPPSDVQALSLNVTDQVIQIDWPAITDCDVAEYLVRYSPTLNGTWESSIPLLRTDRNTTLAQAQARTGTYLIKAVDFNGNESANVAMAITSIPELTGLNIIDETNDFPDLLGELFQTVKDGNALVLQKITDGGPLDNEYYTEGYYYFTQFLDLGEIYTVRLQSLIEAEGFTVDDVMSNWITLSDVTKLANAAQSEWDVETQYRATDKFNTIAEWDLLSDVVTMNNGEEDNWTEWRKFTMGDFTGRIFQFRLKLISNKASVTPRVFNGVIRSDMPDRVESFNNLTIPSTGLTITYTPSFKGPGTSPNIQVTQDDASQGDYYKITDRTLDGFKITFYDISDTAVERTADIFVKGYGRKTTAVL